MTKCCGGTGREKKEAPFQLPVGEKILSPQELLVTWFEFKTQKVKREPLRPAGPASHPRSPTSAISQ